MGDDVEALVDRELRKGAARSQEYRLGLLDLLRYRVEGIPLPTKRFELGTAQADAYWAGSEHGVYLWREMKENPENYLPYLERAAALAKSTRQAAIASDKKDYQK